MGTTRLYLTASVEEQWRALAGPWLREQADTARHDPRPTVIMTPSRAESFYLRGRLVGEGVSFLGLRFWTPSDARKFLLAELLPETCAATQAELRLIARTCAENLAREAPDDATLTSVTRDPGAFLRAYDLLLAAGWDPEQAGAIYGQPLARALRRELEKLQVATQAGLHRLLLRKAASRNEPLLANLLMTGFNATHWPLWDLLRAMVSSAEDGAVSLSAPRVFGEEVDQLWISSWEQTTGLGTVVPEGPDGEDEVAPLAGLVASYERGRADDAGKVAFDFLVTPDLASQVRSIVLQALAYLKQDSCRRLGIVFPEANALALGVAEELRRLGLPLDDGTGALQPGLFERRSWLGWIALQEEPSVPRLVAWLRACEAQGVSCGVAESLSARDVAGVLENALADTLVDDLNFLAAGLEENVRDERAVAVADFLRRRIQLPQTGRFSDFLARTHQAATMPGWEEHLAALPLAAPALRRGDLTVSRRTFLQWLKEATDSRVRTRGGEGNHFYGKVHLLIYAQMTGQTWSHLILTGLNEGVWPRMFETGAFGSRHELEALNRQARALNPQARTQGAQGRGHETVSANRSHCLLPMERRDLGLRDLCAALEGTSEAVCLAAMTTEAGRSLLPSDFFSHAYQAKTSEILTEAVFQDLARLTLEWSRRHEFLLPASELESARDIGATRMAYDARHDETRPFSRYEFAFAEPPALPIQLSCYAWERAWQHPATVWLERIVGASSWPGGELSWSRTVGTWVHRWLTAALRACSERKSPTDFLPLLQAAAERELVRARDRARAADLDLYPWWEQVWGQARSIALALGGTLAPLLQEKIFLSEFKLPKGLTIALPGTATADFALDGRIDLLLLETGTEPCDPSQGDFSGCTAWVIDFKTGSARGLSKKRMAEGAGLQPLLYALAVRALGAKATTFSLHTFDAPLQRQMDLVEALEIQNVVRSLDIFHRAGIFGMRPDAGNAYGFSPAYPMATRFIPGSVLEAKWALVHGVESVGDEEEGA